METVSQNKFCLWGGFFVNNLYLYSDYKFIIYDKP